MFQTVKVPQFLFAAEPRGTNCSHVMTRSQMRQLATTDNMFIGKCLLGNLCVRTLHFADDAENQVPKFTLISQIVQILR
jgi:hypothetical protein